MEGDNEYESLPDNTGPGVHMLAGGLAGLAEHTVMYPVDVVKTRMMALRPNPNARYANPLTALRHIAANEGFTTLFRGVGAVGIGAGPAHALYFSAYEFSKSMFGANDDPGHEHIATAGAAVIATIAHDSVMNPVEVVKQRLQVYGSPYSGLRDCVTKIWHQEGIFAFYRSFTTQLFMNLPTQATHLVTYEWIKHIVNPDSEYSPLAHLIAGGGAGGLAACVTTPFDVAKTLLNTQETCPGAQAATNATLVGRKYVHGIFQAFSTIYRANGLKGFAQGMSPRVLIAAPSTAISWAVYEFFKHFLGYN